MSGIIGHSIYAILGLKAAAQRRLPLAPVALRHWSSYLAGAYLGCDVQTMPEAICVDTGQEVGYGTVPLAASPLTGGAVRPFLLRFQGRSYSAGEIHEIFYGRAHLTFGWSKAEQGLTLPWDHLGDYCAAVVDDALNLFGPGERPLAYVLGWMTHLVGDALIKSVAPGVTLRLLDGQYTPRNRPIQDLFSFHEIGRKELHLRWPAVLADLAETPVEPVQLHWMRVGPRRGRLGSLIAEGWASDRHELLRAVLSENRRYLRKYKDQVLREMELTRTAGRWQCHADLMKAAGGLDYQQMMQMAENARLRQALRQIALAIADLFQEVAGLVPALARFPGDDRPTWDELTRRWAQ